MMNTEQQADVENRYKSFFEGIDQGYFEVDLCGNLTFGNDALHNILMVSKEEILGMNNRQYMDRANAKDIFQIFKKVFRTGKPEIGIMFEIIRKDKCKRKIGSAVSLMRDADDLPIGFRGTVRDISDRKAEEEELTQSKKMESIGQLAAGVAHEINTPSQYVSDNTHFLMEAFQDIEQILNNYQNLLESVKTGQSTDRMVETLESENEKLDLAYLREEIPLSIKQSLEGLGSISKIVNAMREFSHPGSQDKKHVDINKAIESTITVARNEWKYVADMETELDANIPPTPCFLGEFNQVMLNMVINAVHAIKDALGENSADKGKIKITTHKNASWTEVKISDTGSGIPHAIQHKIFDPFFTTKNAGMGTGQGLALAYNSIVKKHKGSITFESEIGRGTTFLIRLPYGDSNE
jgi:PAS domain S-box-containing protein